MISSYLDAIRKATSAAINVRANVKSVVIAASSVGRIRGSPDVEGSSPAPLRVTVRLPAPGASLILKRDGQ